MTGHIRVIATLAVAALACSVLLPGSAWACGCQKEYLIKKYGTLSVLDLPERPPSEAAPAGPAASSPAAAPAATQPATVPAAAPAGG